MTLLPGSRPTECRPENLNGINMPPIHGIAQYFAGMRVIPKGYDHTKLESAHLSTVRRKPRRTTASAASGPGPRRLPATPLRQDQIPDSLGIGNVADLFRRIHCRGGGEGQVPDPKHPL